MAVVDATLWNVKTSNEITNLISRTGRLRFNWKWSQTAAADENGKSDNDSPIYKGLDIVLYLLFPYLLFAISSER